MKAIFQGISFLIIVYGLNTNVMVFDVYIV